MSEEDIRRIMREELRLAFEAFYEEMARTGTIKESTFNGLPFGRTNLVHHDHNLSDTYFRYKR